jgi:O-antigen/teichoic acid export membrane protein
MNVATNWCKTAKTIRVESKLVATSDMLTTNKVNRAIERAADGSDEADGTLALLDCCAPIERISFSRLSGVIAIVDQGVASAATFFASVIVGRCCGATDLGIYSLAFTLVLFCFAVQEALVLAAFTVFYHESGGATKQNRDEYLAITSRQQLLLSLILGSVLLVVGVSVMTLGGSPHLGWTIIAAACAMPFILFREFARRAHCIRGELISALRLDCVVSTVWVISLIFLAWRHALSPATVFLAQAIACAYAITRRSRTKFNPADAWPQIAKHLKFGKWIVASQVASLAHQYLAYWLLAMWHGADATGSFAAAVSLVAITNPLTMGLGNYFGPKMSHDLAKGGLTWFLRTVGSAVSFIGAVMSLIVAFLAFGGGSMLPIIFGSDFHGQHWVITILAISSMIAAIRMMIDLAVRTLNKPTWIFFASISGLTANVVVALWLMPRWEELGAAYGNLAGTLTPLFLLCVGFWMSLKALQKQAAATA